MAIERENQPGARKKALAKKRPTMERAGRRNPGPSPRDGRTRRRYGQIAPRYGAAARI